MPSPLKSPVWNVTTGKSNPNKKSALLEKKPKPSTPKWMLNESFS